MYNITYYKTSLVLAIEQHGGINSTLLIVITYNVIGTPITLFSPLFFALLVNISVYSFTVSFPCVNVLYVH